ncbi:hypothetical protein ACXHXM_36350, partial
TRQYPNLFYAEAGKAEVLTESQKARNLFSQITKAVGHSLRSRLFRVSGKVSVAGPDGTETCKVSASSRPSRQQFQVCAKRADVEHFFFGRCRRVSKYRSSGPAPVASSISLSSVA